jgi:hypothetical protein
MSDKTKSQIEAGATEGQPGAEGINLDRPVMPAVIFASIVGGFEDHGFGGCAWGCGEKYLRRYLPLTDDTTGSVYYSEEKVRALLNMNKADALRELGQI